MSKIDCSITENYFKEKVRMVKCAEDGICDIHCVDCPLCFDNNGTYEPCDTFEKLYPDKAIQIVQKWSDEHSQMTMIDKFKEQHPNAPMDAGYPDVCPYYLGYEKREDVPCRQMNYSCSDCWARPYEDQNDEN